MHTKGVVATALAIALLQSASSAQSDRSTYKGKPASYWVDRLLEASRDAEEAIRAIGTPCVPILIERHPGNACSESVMFDDALRHLARSDPTPFFDLLRTGTSRARSVSLSVLLELEPLPNELQDILPMLLRRQEDDLWITVAALLTRHGIYRQEAVPAVLAALKHQSLTTRWFGAEAAGRYPHFADELVPALIPLTRDPRQELAVDAFVSLGQLSAASASAEEFLLRALRSADPHMRRGALAGFSYVPNPSGATVARCMLLATDSDESVRNTAADALEHLWVHRRVPLGEHRVALGHPDPKVRLCACLAAGHSDKRAKPDLLAKLTDPDRAVRRAAIQAVNTIGDPSPATGKALLGLLNDSDEELGRAAARTLIDLNTRVDEAVLYFVSLIRARRASDRPDLVNLLAAIGPVAKAAVPALREQLTCGYPFTEMEAAWALYVITGTPELSVQAMLRSLKTDDRFHIIRASWLACRLGPLAADAVPLLRKILDHQDPWVRRNAALALGYIGATAKATIPRLKQLLRDQEDSERLDLNDVCFAAAASLARMDVDDARVTNLLTRVLAHEIYYGDVSTIRVAAIRHAWNQGMDPGELVRHIVRALERFSGYPLQVAPPLLRMLGELGPQARPAIPTLQRLLTHRYEIRTAAAAALRKIQPLDSSGSPPGDR